MSKYTTITALSAIALLALSACGTTTATGESSTATSTSASASATASTSADTATGLTVADAWIKASPSNMTGAFAKITNTTDETITITGATSTASKRVELHTTEIDPTTGTSAMKLKDGGFTIDPGQTLELAPGGDHIMLMDMSCALVAGTTAVITVETSAGEIELDAPVRDYSGAKEEYAPGEEHSPAADSTDHSSHDHSSHGHGTHSHGADEHGTGEHSTESVEATLPQCA